MNLRRMFTARHWGMGVGSFLFLIALVLLLTFNSAVTATARAAPPPQDSDPYQLCDLIKDYIIEIDDTKNDFDCVGIVRYVGKAPEAGEADLRSPVKIYVNVYRDKTEAFTYSGLPATNAEAKERNGSPVDVGEKGFAGWFAWNENLVDYSLNFIRGCYVVSLTGRSKVNGMETGIENEFPGWAKEIDAKIAARSNTCPRSTGGNQPAPPAQPGDQAAKPPPAAAEKQFAILGIGCSGNAQETGQAGRVICSVQTDNEPFDEPASYNWSIDSQPVGATRKLTAEGVQQGEHTVSVTATFRGKQYTYNGWVTVAESGTAAKSFDLGVSCAYDKAKGNITCHAAPANPPENASLEYFWIMDGAFNASKTADMTASVPGDSRTYTVEVRALDKTSDTFSKLVSTTVDVGISPLIPPAVSQAVNTALTGEANPPKPNAEGTAGGASVVALGMGLAALVNGLLNSAPAAVKNAASQAAAAVQQSAAEAVKEVRNIPGVKQAENAVTTAVGQAVVEEAAADFLQQAAGGSQQPAQQTVKGEKSPAVVKDKGEKQVGGADTSSYIPGVSELVHGALNTTDTKTVTTSQGGEKTTTPVDQSAETEAEKQVRADAQARGTFDAFLQETPESSKQSPTTADKVMEDVFQATDYEKAQQNAKNLMTEYLEKYQEFKDKRRQGDWASQNRSREPEADHSISDALSEKLYGEADQLEKEAKELEKKFQEAVKQLGASDTSGKGKSK